MLAVFGSQYNVPDQLSGICNRTNQLAFPRTNARGASKQNFGKYVNPPPVLDSPLNYGPRGTDPRIGRGGVPPGVSGRGGRHPRRFVRARAPRAERWGTLPASPPRR